MSRSRKTEPRRIGLLSWPTYGTRLPGPARGRIESFDAAVSIPEPDPVLTARNARSVKWPVAQLSPQQQQVVLGDLLRVASIRGFECIAAVASDDHVHVLLGCRSDSDVPRLVQLAKGALSRALTVAGGDRPGRTAAGNDAPHHKWWGRQYIFQTIDDPQDIDRIQYELEEHEGRHV